MRRRASRAAGQPISRRIASACERLNSPCAPQSLAFDEYRSDFALFMVDALTNDTLIHEAPAIIGCKSPSALAHASTGPGVAH
jgi:hypothetical protein